MSRPAASDRVRRLLSLVPWVAAHPGGVPIDEVCERFGIERRILLADLETLMMVGLPPFTPDTFVDVMVDDDRVWIQPQWFDRPLKLTPDQALALVAAGASLLEVPGADPTGPLARGLDKLAAALGVERTSLEVDLGPAEPQVVAELVEARRQGRAVRIDYYAYGRDEHTTRVVEPWAVYHDGGHWYLQAWCRAAEGERVFRVDRVAEVEVLDEPVTTAPEDGTLAVFQPSPDDPRVVLDLAPAARWVAEHHPCQSVIPLEGGGVRVELIITARPWLERLLVRLGPHARVVEADDRLAGCGRAAAERILTRYAGGTPASPDDGR